MECPKCFKSLTIMSVIDTKNYGNIQTKRVVGRCDKCDYDGSWTINYKNGKIEETNLKRYFWG